MKPVKRKRDLLKLGKWAGLTLIVAAASCVQVLDGAYDYQPLCTVDIDCDDANPCSIDECLPDNSCLHTAGPNGLLPIQTAGDCKRDECIDGEVFLTNDDTDIADDGEPCTTDSCSSGLSLHVPVADGTKCVSVEATGICSMGVCSVECSVASQCNDGNPCTDDSCNVGVGTCTFALLDGTPTPGFQEPVGDCKLHICVLGLDTVIDDDFDVSDDLNSCTDDVCTAGVPSNPSTTLGTPCVVGQPETCDGQGSCVQCNVAADCVLLPPDDECQQRVCTNNVCGQTFTTIGTPISMQTMGDCKQVVCDGAGATTVENFDTDLPADKNPCTQDLCNLGIPANPAEPAGVSCGGGFVCDDIGMCVGCNVATDCVGTDDFCKIRTCINQMCGYSFTPIGTDLPNGQTGLDCKVVECDGSGNTVISVDISDKPVDGNQCTQDSCSTQGVPSNPFEAANFPCNQNGGTACNGAGACKKINGAVCVASADCLSSFCVDGVCCNAACGASCKSCNVPGSVGTCANVVKANEDAPGCTGANSCDGSGTCKKDDGQTCLTAGDCVSSFCVDGVCCNAACSATCKSCNVPGSVGACSNVPSGLDDINGIPTCSGTNQSCDGVGACKKEIGQICAGNTECLSSFCVDGVCCNSSCTTMCRACNLAGSVGVCSNVATGQDDTGTCSGVNQSCDGAGACKKENAQTCAAGTECLSGFCADGYCCNTACSGVCQACSALIKGTGADGACGFIAAGIDPQDECVGALVCDGIGSCQ